MRPRRARGTGGLFQRGRIWWISYSIAGKQHQESSRSTVKKEAKRLVRDRLWAVDQGKLAGGKPITIAQLEPMIENDREMNNKINPKRFAPAFKHVKRLLGAKTKARDISQSSIEMYKSVRLAKDAARATINAELAWLRRGLKLAHRHGRIATVPEIVLLSGTITRTGFFTDEQFAEVLRKLPAKYRDPVEFLFLTGWRRGEALALEWRNVDRKAKVIRIEETKTREPRTIPYGTFPELVDVVERRWQARPRGAIDPKVFGSIKGDPLLDAFKKASREAGFPGWMIHDLRRSAARRMLRAGIPQPVIMKICGWKSDAVFRRYAIVDEALIAEGLAKLSKS